MPGDIFAHTNIAKYVSNIRSILTVRYTHHPHSQFHSFDDNANSVLSYAVDPVGVEHGQSHDTVSIISLTGLHFKTVVLVGHSGCGGVKAAIEAAAAGPVEPHNPLTRWLNPLIRLVRTLDLRGLPEDEAVAKVVEANIFRQVDNICNSEPIVTAWAAGNNVFVHGWVYNLATGRIRELVVRSLPSVCS